MAKYADIEREAIKLVLNEKTAWEEGEVYLTEKISFQCRNIIKRARKNYFGIYDKLYDPVTNRKKVFLPLTRDMVETTVKNIDIDTKDIGVRAKVPEAYGLATLSRYILAAYFDKLHFGQILNRTIRKAAVEGVAVLKKINRDKKINISLIENLNFITDPTANYLSESSGNTEINWLTVAEAHEYKEWENLSKLVGRTSVEKIPYLPVKTEIPYVDIAERWGLMPKYFITGEKKDKNKYIEGIIVISGLYSNPVVQLIAENKTWKRPYQEFRLKMFDGRWAGMGVGEDLFDLQSYINEIFNIRLNTSRIKQLGLFEVRKGAGVTPQMLSQLYSGGAIQVNQIGRDIAELRTSDIKSSSYKDEQQAYLWAQRMTGAWEVGRGEALPASMPATTAVLQQQGMNTGFALQQEELGFAISQFIEDLLLPSIYENLTDKEIMRITGDLKELHLIDDHIINNLLNEQILDFHKKNGYYPSQQEIEREKLAAKEKFQRFGKDRFIQIKKSLFKDKEILDGVEVFVTGESFNKMVVARQLNDLLLNYSKLAGVNIDTDKIVGELLNLMGLSADRFMKTAEQVQPPQVNQPRIRLPEGSPVLPMGANPVTAIPEQVSSVATPKVTGQALTPAL